MNFGCDYRSNGDQQAAEATSGVIADRARQVAKAWDGSVAAETWRAGYHPMSDVTQPPRGGFRSQADERAYREKNFVLRTKLPTTWPKTGQVAWAHGGELSRPLASAEETYRDMTGGQTGGESHLAVTSVKLGEMTITTGRGPATVPAWLFSLGGYGSPVRRAAAVPSELPDPPIKGAPEVPIAELHHLVELDTEDRSVTVVTTHSVCEEASAVDVHETKGSVVLSASAVNRKNGSHCTKQAKLRQVTVRLDRPVGERMLLDARTGLPVPFRAEDGPSPSWS